MTLFKNYVEYFKNNPEGYWFKRKLYGWGWTPVKWQGWFVLLIFIVLIFCNVVGLLSTNEGATFFLAKITLCVLLLILVCYYKGEKPKWQWGVKK